jgi:putative FmdB family regulatory protein
VPTYDFQCIECGERTTMNTTMGQYEAVRDELYCECGSRMARQYGSVAPNIDRHVPGFYGTGRNGSARNK